MTRETETGAAKDYYAISPHHRQTWGFYCASALLCQRGPAGQGRKNLFVVELIHCHTHVPGKTQLQMRYKSSSSAFYWKFIGGAQPTSVFDHEFAKTEVKTFL